MQHDTLRMQVKLDEPGLRLLLRAGHLEIRREISDEERALVITIELSPQGIPASGDFWRWFKLFRKRMLVNKPPRNIRSG